MGDDIHSTNKQYKVHLFTLTNWSQPIPHSITSTDPDGVPSSESVAVVYTGVGGHRVHWSAAIGSATVGDHFAVQWKQVRTNCTETMHSQNQVIQHSLRWHTGSDPLQVPSL